MSLYDEMLALVSRKKATPGGWVSFNAVCCQHNGESPDKKRRGGLKKTDDNGVSYHCFNCGFKASWRPGRNLGKRMRSLLGWMGASDDQINRIAFECLRTEGQTIKSNVTTIPDFQPRSFPPNTVKITTELIQQDERVIPIVEYIYSRGLTLDDSDFYWSNEPGFQDRMIIPLSVNKVPMGYIARKIYDGKPKYITEHPAHIVYGLDRQPWDRKFVLVFEGSIDAMLLDGIAILTNEVSPEQALQINNLGREVIVVPDRDKPGETMINHAVDLGWSVAFPNWEDDVKDAADAVLRYGRLTTMISIVTNVERNPLKIKLRMKL
jgi:hypothetical protein